MDDSFEKAQHRLARKLNRLGVQQKTVKAILNSGYYLLDSCMTKGQYYVGDSFYGTKVFTGFIPFNYFMDFLRGYSPFKATPHIHNVKCMQDVLSVLEENKWYKKGLMSFRGQNKEYFMHRSFPNLFQEDGGKERLIIPGYWRKFREEWNDRFSAPQYKSLFKSIYGDFLTYYGLPSVDKIAKYNIEKYGFHTMSDMEDFEEDFNKEYNRRWRSIKIDDNADLPVIEQHYGIETPYLDVTFDLKVALFFATHQYHVENGKSFYTKIPKGKHKGVVYAFVFHDPPVTSTSDIIQNLSSFYHISPVRPLRQKCALRLFDAYGVNEAVTDIDTIFYLDKDFNDEGIATFEELFPAANEDKFYKALLDMHERYGDITPLNQFAIYEGLKMGKKT